MKKWVFPGVLIFCIFAFGVYETVFVDTKTPLLLAEKNVALLHLGQGNVLGMGQIQTPTARALARHMQGFFSFQDVVHVSDIPQGSQWRGQEFLVQRVSEGLIKTTTQGRSIWWIEEGFSEADSVSAVQSGVEFEADWWLMTQNTIPEFLPLPDRGIVFIGDRSPSQTFQRFARENRIPLLLVKEGNGVSAILSSEKEWILKTRTKGS